VPDELIRPFRIQIPQTDLDDLAERLARTRWPDELPGAGREYGVPLAHVRALADRWSGGYDWRAQEKVLNDLGQFVTTVDGQQVHFLHLRSPEPDALPLLLTHGWPGSFVEFLAVLGPLSDPRAHDGDPADAFHLVVPSIPGFGLSGPTRERGWDVDRIATAWVELMRRLGYDRYGTQGGDWGAAISTGVAALRPDRVVGVHLNYLPTPPRDDVDGLSDEDTRRLENTTRYLANRAGYWVQQSTRPQTLAYALTDTPVGQLAWIAEKFLEWTDPASEIDPDVLLTNVMIYWLTGTAGSSARLYRENALAPRTGRPPLTVPVGVAICPHDLVLPVRAIAEWMLPIARWTELDRGGHFAALEVPGPFTDDVRAFFRPLRR
jgi:epoxide hydrolase